MAEPTEAPKPWEALRQRATDQNAATFVNPGGGIEVFQKGALGDAQQRALTARGLKPATPEDIEKRATFLENSTTENQTRAALDLATNVATAGAVGKEDLALATDKPGAVDARREALEQASPGVALGARIVGGAIPMALTGGLAGAAGAGAAAVGAAEGVGAGLAEENADAAWHNRELSAGNVALAGLGGAVFSSAIPAILRRGSRALAGSGDAVAAAAGEVAENLGPQLEAKAAARAAGKVDKIPPGPARDAILTQNAPAHLERVQTEIGDVAARAPQALEKTDLDRGTLKRLIAKDAPNQTQWATETAEQLRGLAEQVPPQGPPLAEVPPTVAAKAAPPNLAGKTLEDLKALPIEGADDLARVKALKEHPQFAAEGTVPANDASHGITLVNDGGETVLRDGRHRLTAAQELGHDSIKGRYVDGETGKVLYEGDIPLKAEAGEAAPASGIRRNAKGARIGELRQGEGAPVDLSDWDMGDFAKGRGRGTAAGKTSADYSGGETISQYQRSIVDGLKKNEQFAATGRIAGDAGKLGSEPTIHVLPDSTLQLGHGRLRITAARELGLKEIYGRVVLGSGKDAKQVFEGMIPVGRGAAKAAEEGAAGAAPAAAIPPPPGGNALRDAASSLLDSRGALDTLERARGALRSLRSAGAPQEAIDALQKGIADQSLFGRAAEAVSDFDAAHAKLPGSPLEGFEPGNMTQASREQLTAMAEALEDRAAARAKWDAGGGKDAGAQRLLQDAKRIRDNIGLADDVAGARGRAAPTAPAAPGTEKPESALRGFAKDAALEAVVRMGEHAIGHVLPGAGLLLKGARYLWSNVDASGAAAINAAARTVARGAMRGAEAVSSGVGKVVPALAAFSEGFPGPHEAYAARAAMLTEMSRDPTMLANAMAESFGDLPRENPKLFAQMAQRMARATHYVTANLPAGISTSMAYPRGVPPSQSSLREFAVIWNSAMDPHTVVEAVGNGSATPAQVKTLAAVDPDAYQNLLQAVTKEVGNNYAQMPAQTKQWLDILFQSDGIAGPGFSWKAAQFMTEGEKQNPRGPMPMEPLPPPSKQAPTARGLDSIAMGVTNRGA